LCGYWLSRRGTFDLGTPNARTLERFALALALVNSPIDVAFDQPGQSWRELRCTLFNDQRFDDSECVIRVETLDQR
jgi:hypothetical protein